MRGYCRVARASVQYPAIPMTTTPASLQERYDIIAALPGTSLYSVYSAIERESDDAVEIRAPRTRALENAETLGPFRALMERHRDVHHAHLGRLLDIHSEEDSFWMVYEPARGEQLRGWLTRGLQLDEALLLISQAAAGLQALHDADLIHGDANSRNLFVTPVAGAQLRNAGLSELSIGMSGLQSSMQIPQPAYMAPEVLRGSEPGPKADIFSLGMVLYESLTGHLPFTGNNRDTVRVKQQEGRIAPITVLNPALPEALEEIVGRALAWDPNERFSSAQEMREVLLEYRNNLSMPEAQIVVPDERARQEILDDIAQFEPSRISLDGDGTGEFRVCAECLTINLASVTRCAVCWRDIRENPVRNRTEGEAYAQRTRRRRTTRKWAIRGSVAFAVLALLALFIYDRGAPPGLLTGPPTTTLTAQAGSGLWTTPRGGAANSGSVASVDIVPQGVERWRLEIGAEINSSPTIDNGRIFVTTLDSRILAYSTEDGSLIWEQQGPGPMDAAPIVADDRLYITFRNSRLAALEADTGEVIWESVISNPLFSWAGVSDGSVYVACQNGVIQAFDAGTGEKRWEIDTDDGMVSPPSVSEGMVIIPTRGREVLFLVGETGQTRLSYVVPGTVEGAAAVSHGTAALGDSRGFVRAVDIRAQNLPLEKTVLRFWSQFYIWGLAPFPPAQSGTMWTRSIREEVWADAAIAGNRAYFATREGNVYAFTLSGGQQLWKTALGDEPTWTGSPTVVNTVLYIGSESGTFYALDAVSGEHLWNLDLGDSISSSPAYADGKLFVMTDSGTLYAFD